MLNVAVVVDILSSFSLSQIVDLCCCLGSLMLPMRIFLVIDSFDERVFSSFFFGCTTTGIIEDIAFAQQKRVVINANIRGIYFLDRQ